MNHHEQSRYQDIDDKITLAQKKTWEAVEKIAQQIEPGMTESQAIKLAQSQLLQMGTRKFWHKCHVRFGASTILSFNDPYEDKVLGEHDIFYVDIGPIWEGIEGDAGATFVVGNPQEMIRCRDDVKRVFDDVSNYWHENKSTGMDLYQYAEGVAKQSGWILAPSYVRGHRLSEFPHSFHSKLRLNELDFHPSSQRWVLEIHICDPDLKFGAFYEDTLRVLP